VEKTNRRTKGVYYAAMKSFQLPFVVISGLASVHYSLSLKHRGNGAHRKLELEGSLTPRKISCWSEVTQCC